MKILIVDSDPATHEAILPLLKSRPGDEVRTAHSGEEGLQIAMQWGALDLLIAEVFTEPMNGFTLRNKLQNRLGSVRAILLSEYDLSDYAEHVEDCITVAKPVQADVLLAAIERTIPSAPPKAAEPEQKVKVELAQPAEVEEAPKITATKAVEPAPSEVKDSTPPTEVTPASKLEIGQPKSVEAAQPETKLTPSSPEPVPSFTEPNATIAPVAPIATPVVESPSKPETETSRQEADLTRKVESLPTSVTAKFVPAPVEDSFAKSGQTQDPPAAPPATPPFTPIPKLEIAEPKVGNATALPAKLPPPTEQPKVVSPPQVKVASAPVVELSPTKAIPTAFPAIKPIAEPTPARKATQKLEPPEQSSELKVEFSSSPLATPQPTVAPQPRNISPASPGSLSPAVKPISKSDLGEPPREQPAVKEPIAPSLKQATPIIESSPAVPKSVPATGIPLAKSESPRTTTPTPEPVPASTKPTTLKPKPQEPQVQAAVPPPATAAPTISLTSTAAPPAPSTIVRRRATRPDPSKQRKVKLIRYSVLGACLLAAGAVGGYHGYKQWIRHHLVQKADSYLARDDLRGASITAQRALQLNPDDLDAALIMAKIGERVSPEEAIRWRRLILEHRPDDVDNLVRLAALQMASHNPSETQRLLAGAGSKADLIPEYHKLEGQLAYAHKDFAGAETHFLKATQLDPKNDEYQLLLSKTQLISNDSAHKAAAKERLSSLSKNSSVKVEARQLLFEQMLTDNDRQGARELANEMVHDSKAPFDQRLLALGVLHRLRLPEFASALTALQQESLESAARINDLMNWLLGQDMALYAVDWAKKMPRRVSSDPALTLAVAQAYGKMGDWATVKGLLQTGDFGSFKYLAEALESRAFRDEGRNGASHDKWETALLDTNGSQQQLAALKGLAENWHWNDEAEEVLWNLVQRPAPADWVFASLEHYLFAKKDTQALLRLFSRKHEVDPNDKSSANHVAFLSLLLNKDDLRAQRLAVELYHSTPGDANIASTYAFSLYRQGNVQEALEILCSFPEAQLGHPSIEVAYVAILAASGSKEKARTLASKIDRSELLPEENRVLDDAGKSLSSSAN